MRITLAVVLSLCPIAAFAQSPCIPSGSSILQFDPYKPSHTAIVRNYGATALANLPLSDLMKLDPYVPSQAALLRQLGGAIPLWTYPASPGRAEYLAPSIAPQASPCEPMTAAAAPVMTTLSEVWAALEQRRPSAIAAAAVQRPGAPAAGRNSGITLEHDGRAWVSAGQAVPFREGDFTRVGESGGTPVFRRVAGDEGVIYVPTSPGMVAPFKAVR